MSDTPYATPAATARRRRGPAQRKQITVDGKIYVPRDEMARKVGISPRTAARKCTNVRYVGGVATVEHDQALRDLLGLNPPRRAGRGPFRKFK